MYTLLTWRLCLHLITAGMSFLSGPPQAAEVEICENALDDDGDGLIDLNDPDCQCPEVKPVSLISNPSFEEQTCCPGDRSQLNCSKDWIQASDATTDYLHTCGWMGWPDLPPPLPFPDGQGAVGFRNGRFGNEAVPNWKEYAGACLQAPMRSNNIYRFEFYVGFTNPVNSPPLELVFFGATDCKYLPFGLGNPNFGCPTNGPGWIRLKSIFLSGANQWIKTGLEFAPPQDIYAIAIGPNCTELDYSVNTYYFFDDLVLADQKSFGYEILPSGHPCSADFQLRVPAYDTLDYQWYKEGIALVGETGPELQVKTGAGEYIVRLIGPTSCRVTKPFRHIVPVLSSIVEEHICPGDTYPFRNQFLSREGTYLDTIKSVQNCDSIIQLNLFIGSDEEQLVQARIFPGEKYPVGNQRFGEEGQFRVNLQSVYGCDSLVLLDLSLYKIFIPNVFSPNGDGDNDLFNIFGGADLLAVKRLQVFDRWGNQLYAQKDLPPNDRSAGWNGQVKGQPAANGVYVYVAEVEMDDGKSRQVAGSVMLLR